MPRENTGPKLGKSQSGTFEIRWTESGRSKRISTGTANLREAQQVLAGWLTQKESAQKSRDALSFDEAVQIYDRDHVSVNVAQPDRERYAFAMLGKYFSGSSMTDVTAADIAAYARARRSGKISGQRKPQAGDGTIRRELGVLKAIVNHAVKQRIIRTDDFPNIDLPPRPASKDLWLDESELDMLITASQPNQNERVSRAYRFIAIARYTAARKASIETLTWSQVDLAHRVIDFRQRGVRATKKRRVAVPISETLFKILTQAEAEKISDFVLDHGGSIRTTFESAVERAAELALATNNTQSYEKILACTPHTLRHSWATNAVRAGVDLWKVAGVLGDDVATVTANYLHHTPDHLRSAVEANDGERNAGRNAQSGR